jgi:hypothetical protein
MDVQIERTKHATGSAIFQEKWHRLAAMNPQLYYQLGLDESRPNAKPLMQFTDGSIVAAKGGLSALSTYEDLVALDDAIRRPGADTLKLTDLNEGKLPKDEFFLVETIQVLFTAGVTGSGAAVIGNASWGLIPDIFRNGTFELTQKGRVIVPEISMEVFYNPVQIAVNTSTYAATYIGNGVFKLDNAKVLYPEEKIDINLRFGAALTANDAIKVVLGGVKTYRMG